MKARHFLPALLFVFSAGPLQATSAQEVQLSLGQERAPAQQTSAKVSSAVQTSRSSGYANGRGVRSSTHQDRRRSSYGRGYGSESGRGYGNQRHICVIRPYWVAGHYEIRGRQVFVPGSTEKVWIDAVYEDGFDECGRRIRRLVRAGCWEYVQHPGHYESRSERVWIPGRFENRSCCTR